MTNTRPDTANTSVFSVTNGLRWEELEDEYIVFNPLSDEIHRLNPMAAAVLAELEAEPLTIEVLATRLAPLIATRTGDQLHTQLRGIIAQFDELGLVFVAQHPAQAS